MGWDGFRLLFVTPEYFDPVNAEAVMNRKLVTALRRHGASVDVVAQCSFHRAGLERSCQSAEPETRARAEGLRERLSRWLGAARRQAGRPLGGCLFEQRTHVNQRLWARWAAQQAVGLCQRNPYHVLLSTTAWGHLAAWRIHHRTRIPWVANWNDPFPKAKYPPPYGQGAGARIPSRYQRLLERVGATASWHTFPAPRLRRYLLEYLPRQVRERSSVIPHLFVDQGEVAPAPRGSAFVLCHAGDLHRQRRPETFLQALARLRRTAAGEALRLRFVGRDQAGLVEQARGAGLEDLIEYSPWGTYQESLAAMSASHVLVLIEAPLADGIFLPSKVTDYVQAGRPILAVSPRNGTLADLLGAHGGGLAVDCTDPDAIFEALRALYNSWDRGSLAQDYSPARLCALFSDAAVIPQYQELFERLAGRR
jgi:glycosyltransferase involved in cell wall biosynthesis